MDTIDTSNYAQYIWIQIVILFLIFFVTHIKKLNQERINQHDAWAPKFLII